METLNEKELKIFKESIKDKLCEFEGCSTIASGIIRTKNICNKHFKRIRRDNRKRILLDIQIDSNLNLLK